MTIAPLGSTPTNASPTATTGAKGAAPTDFVSAILDALTAMGAKPPADVAPQGKPALGTATPGDVETSATPADVELVEAPAAGAPTQPQLTLPLPSLPTTTKAQPAVEPKDTEPTKGEKKDDEPVEATAGDAQPVATQLPVTAPATVPAHIAALVGQYSLIPNPRQATSPKGAGKQDVEAVGAPAAARHLDKLDVQGSDAPTTATTSPHLDKLDVPARDVPASAHPKAAVLTPPVMDEPKAPAAVPGPPEPSPTPDLAVAGASTSAPVTAVQPTTAQPTGVQVPITTAPVVSAPATTPAAPNTTHLDHVAAQVFPEVTSLVSRGNGTHRIALTLNPEHLGEVRVVMTMRDGAVHVRLAAGSEAHASLVDGSPELSRLLEHAGATETRVVVRDLPAAATSTTTNPSTPTTDSSSATGNALTGDRSPDQHAGTRADHQARDGSDHHPRSTRTDGQITGVHRSIQPVTNARTAGVDLTM